MIEIIGTLIHNMSTSMFHLLVLPVAVFSAFFYFFGFVGLMQRRKTAKTAKAGKLPKVTIQIPTFNEPVAIRCAEHCLSMDYPENKYEILIGDDSSNKNVSSMLDQFASKHKGRIKIVRRASNAGFKAGNLNNMTRHSTGDIIIVFDSDFIAPKDFLKRIVQPFADKKVACVQSKWSYLNIDQSPTSKFASTVLMVYHNILAKLNNNAGVPLLFGSGEAVKKDILVKLGGWQEGSVTEDVEFSVRALENGYRSIYLDDLCVAGEVPYNVRALRTQQRRWAYGNAKAFIEHRKSILLGKFSLKQKALMTLTMLGYVSSFFLVAFMFFGAVSFMTGDPAAINVPRLVVETSINFLIASGFTFAGIVALWRENKMSHALVVFFSALSIGIIVSLSVCNGVFKAILGRPMYWIVIVKKGNVDFRPSTYGIVVAKL
ncbi:MAG TPA: glycosyltransferase [archaeon]|nr:glycosyltransferase [archaeon]